MRESNFSNPFQNKASVCISAAIYDRRALDCSATLPLINSLNHLAYLTSTSPRIREMVCLDGGLERLIRILRQVPRSPSQPPMRGVITKEMQAVWKWSLAFQCVVNIGVRGSESVRTRVVEAGMVPVAVRVLESYLRIAEAIRDERKREAKREEAKQRLERAAESVLLAIDVATPTAASTRRALFEASTTPQVNPRTLNPPESTQNSTTTELTADETRPTTPAEAMLNNFMISNSSSSSSIHHGDTDLPDAHAAATAAVDGDDVAVTGLTSIDALAAEGGPISPSSSASSVRLNNSDVHSHLGNSNNSDRRASSTSNNVAQHGNARETSFATGILTNVSSVEDFTASGSGSDGAEDGDMEGGDESDPGTVPMQRDQTILDGQQMDEIEDRTTPRPPRRSLAPVATSDSRHQIHSHMNQFSENAGPSNGIANRHNVRNRQTPVASGTIQPRDRANATMEGQTFAGDLTQTPRNVVPMATAAPQLTTQFGAVHNERGNHHPGTRTSLTNGERDSSHSNTSDMIYREEEVLLSLQLLAYLSKYAHVRTLFHRDLATLNFLDPLEALDGHHHRENGFTGSWSPNDPPKKNVFCVAERYTLRSSRTGLSHFASMGESRIAPEIQYWAGVIMRNACRKDEKQGGIRQCANMLCGKWEKQPREFAKCRRCRKAKYCSKQCQSKGWQMGHRFWCSARSDEEHGEGSKDRAKDRSSNSNPTATGPIMNDAHTETLTGDVTRPMNVEEVELDQRRNHQHHHHHRHHHGLDEDRDRTVHDGIGRHPAVRAVSLGEAENVMRDGLDVQSVAEGSMDISPLSGPRRVPEMNVSGSSSSNSFNQGNRRAVSAIPQHLQLPSHVASTSGDTSTNSLRSRTTSVASSSADVSDMSEDEMERASRRVLASTVAPASRSPAGVLTALANVHTATMDDEAGERMENGESVEMQATNGRTMLTRTDLAGRPLTPPVIASHDGRTSLDVDLTPDNDLLAMGGRLTPTAVDETEAGVFGRGDFDQMIWRGRTPSMEDHNRARSSQYRAMIPSQNASASTSQENLDEQVAIAGPSHSEPSMLNSALSLAGQGDTATPRFPSSHLHAPVARQPHRFASVNATSSPVGSSSNLAGNNLAMYATVGPPAARRHDGNAAGRSFADRWRSHLGQQMSDGNGSAPATSNTFGILPPHIQRESINAAAAASGENEQFVIPNEISELLHSVETRNANRSQQQEMDVD